MLNNKGGTPCYTHFFKPGHTEMVLYELKGTFNNGGPFQPILKRPFKFPIAEKKELLYSLQTKLNNLSTQYEYLKRDPNIDQSKLPSWFLDRKSDMEAHVNSLLASVNMIEALDKDRLALRALPQVLTSENALSYHCCVASLNKTITQRNQMISAMRFSELVNSITNTLERYNATFNVLQGIDEFPSVNQWPALSDAISFP